MWVSNQATERSEQRAAIFPNFIEIYYTPSCQSWILIFVDYLFDLKNGPIQCATTIRSHFFLQVDELIEFLQFFISPIKSRRYTRRICLKVLPRCSLLNRNVSKFREAHFCSCFFLLFLFSCKQSRALAKRELSTFKSLECIPRRIRRRANHQRESVTAQVIVWTSNDDDDDDDAHDNDDDAVVIEIAHAIRDEIHWRTKQESRISRLKFRKYNERKRIRCFAPKIKEFNCQRIQNKFENFIIFWMLNDDFFQVD